MAAAGPRGRDGPSPREFTVIRHFMMANLGLSGLPLLVYAHIFGFCDGGGANTSRARAAWPLLSFYSPLYTWTFPSCPGSK